ncbi:O-antigen ligase family protein [Desulfosarcina alkanivorans]|nr:O-antigen ligase family protein [Desulfosarcina alkanivorans]
MLIVKNFFLNQKPNTLIAVIFLSSFFLNAFPHVNSIKDILFYIAFIVFIVLAAKKKIAIDVASPLTLPILLILVWAVLTSVFAYKIGDSFDSLFSHLVKYIFLWVLVTNVFGDEAMIEWFIRTAIVSILIFCAGAIVYFYVIQANNWSTRLGFDSAAHNIICFGANIAVVFSIYEFRNTKNKYLKSLIATAILICITTTFLTQSRGGILALVASVFCLFLLEKNLKIILPVLLIITIGLLGSPVKERFFKEKSVSNQHRLGAILYYIEVIKDHPVKGTGYAIDIFDNEKVYANERYFNRIPKIYRKDIYVIFPHNMFLSIGVRMGLVGIGLYLYLLSAYFFMGIKTSVRGVSVSSKALARTMMASMVVFLVGGMFEPVFIHQLDMIFFSLLAMTTVLWKVSFTGTGRRDFGLGRR